MHRSVPPASPHFHPDRHSVLPSPGFAEVSRFSWETVRELRCSDRVHGGCNPAHSGRGTRRGRRDDTAVVRVVLLLRNRHDADISRYIPGSTTTALLSSNPEVPSPVRGGCTGRYGREENALLAARTRERGGNRGEGGEGGRKGTSGGGCWQKKRVTSRVGRGIVDGGLASPLERPTGQFRLEPRGRRATGRLSAPFFRYSFISFRFSSSSVPID